MIGRCQQRKPNASPQAIKDALNDRIRQAIDSRPFWSDLLRRGSINFPNQYATGTATTTTGSTLIVGSGTAWPVSDVASTTLPNGVNDPGVREVVVSSLAGITADSYLFVDAGTPSAETVPVTNVVAAVDGSGGGYVTARFQYSHAPGVSATISSLSGQQFRFGVNYPILTVRSVRDPQTIETDLPWTGAPLVASAYYILKMYVTLAVNLKGALLFVDRIQGIPLAYPVSQNQLNGSDPQRSNLQSPLCISPLSPNESGNMQYEVWPAPTSAYSIDYIYYLGWPDLEDDNDQPPWFIDPQVFIDGAIADMLRTKMLDRGMNRVDPWFDPKLADVFEKKAEKGLQIAIQSDEARCMTAYEMEQGYVFGLGNNYFWNHDIDLLNWNL